ncbi:MAG: Bug family tripartite tricarboxylate transporter substrate binding protein [Burkholderiales bacterium]
MKRIFLGILALCFCTAAFAQNWPNRPIRVLVGFAPGGTSDLSARLPADLVSKELGQTVLVENRPGASGAIAIEALVRSAADGYTLVVGSDSAFYQPVINPKLPYRSDRDLAPITILVNQPIIIAVHPAPGWKSINDMVRATRAQPGEVAYAISSPTGTQALAGLLFFQLAKAKLTPVPYKGGGQAVIDLVSGQVPIAVLGSGPIVPQAKAGRIRMLAVTSGKRSRALPEVPTLAESGYPQIDIVQWFGVMGKAGTPPEIINRLSVAYNKALADPTIDKRLFAVGAETAGSTPQEMLKRMKAEMTVWTKAAKEAGMGKRK